MRILMASKACVVGAYQRKLEEMARLPDVELRVVVPPNWRDARGDLKLEHAHVTGYDLQVTPIRFNGHFHLYYYPRFGRQVRAFQPDIVHIDEEPYNLATWHMLWQSRRHSRAKTLFFSWQNIARRYPWPVHQGEQWVLRQADYAIMGTQGAADAWRSKGYQGPAAVIPQFGVDPDPFCPPLHPSRCENFVVGFVGRLVEEKGGACLLDALAQLDSPWQLHILGDGPEKKALMEQAGRLQIAERITFGTLPSTQMPGYYQKIDVLVVPSLTRPNWKEQFGRVIVEAMACGVPVIGSSSGAIPDVIADAGLIFPEGDRAALTACLQQVMDAPDLRRDLGIRGRQRVVDHYTQTQVAVQTVAVYREMLGIA